MRLKNEKRATQMSRGHKDRTRGTTAHFAALYIARGNVGQT
jgi:hypothetical protein